MINTLNGILSAQLYLLIALNRQKNSQGPKWRSGSALKVLLVTEKSRIPQSQIFPFYYYARQFKEKWNVEFKEINIDSLEAQNGDAIKQADRIFFQPWFVKGEKKIVQLLQRIKLLNRGAKIALFDSNAPTDFRFAETVNPYVDFYVKKHALADRLEYGKVTFGDHQLVQYYNRLCRNPEAKQVFSPISQSFLDKLVIGPSFFTSREMLPFFDHLSRPWAAKKTINLNARMKTKGSTWFNSMRERALKTCLDVPYDAMVISDATISDKKNRHELRASRLCFSPFGYGEICWRDFEAILCGALLIKPDLSHLEINPQLFVPLKTYVPVKWDFSDLDEKITYYLDNEDISAKIIDNAYNAIHEYVHSEAFVNQYARLFE